MLLRLAPAPSAVVLQTRRANVNNTIKTLYIILRYLLELPTVNYT